MHNETLRQRGFTLIEALVALLVLSIGLLGVAAMQLEAMQGAHAAYQRSIASLAAQDAQERLWAQLAINSQGSSSIICLTAAQVDVIESDWEGVWSTYLPGLDESPIDIANIGNCEFGITVSWAEARLEDQDEGSTSFSYSVRLPGE
ncbi:MAG: type IV pilus modification protein PilV [Halomonas sp.]|uniref:type IV pilus modification protein PilV n=1 Tax=Halomonas sp. TaxID=1486246 RepID=UPI002ACD939D|nr:type IV pilus modification protein PilV [Halomonas sp.]MDZ7854226.1 type IV pilus modification protein PilV [Halomonas sp.]